MECHVVSLFADEVFLVKIFQWQEMKKNSDLCNALGFIQLVFVDSILNIVYEILIKS